MTNVKENSAKIKTKVSKRLFIYSFVSLKAGSGCVAQVNLDLSYVDTAGLKLKTTLKMVVYSCNSRKKYHKSRSV